MRNVVFYSWQSDLDKPTTQHFIQQALARAAKSISIDEAISVEPVIDRDTSGVPGAPDIRQSIFDKITTAAVFVADVSIINCKHKELRPTPNPNVLVELGFALRALGETRLVLVMNTEYGEPEQLPFDLKMRHVITYRMSKGALSHYAERKKLEKDLATALRSIFRMQEGSPSLPAITSGTRGRRLAEVIRLMNEAWGYEKFPVSVIAEAMGVEYLNELENYINGFAEPSIAFLTRFCERFGVSADWLKHGMSAPFAPVLVAEPLDCLSRLRAVDPERIFMVKSRAPRGEVGIVIKLDHDKYVAFLGDWPVSSQVGAGGAIRIYDFYQLIRTLRSSELRHRLSGRLYEKRDFHHLFGGTCYPGFVDKPGSVASHWWDDFGDTETPHLSKQQLAQMWGDEFVHAQEIVLEQAALRRSDPLPMQAAERT